MSPSFRQAVGFRKGRNAPQSCPPPGSGLWALIECTARDRPAYRIADGLPVPRLTWTAEAHHYDIEPESVGIRADVASHLDSERGGARKVESSVRSRLQLARLTAAAYRDIGGNRIVDIAEHLDYGGNQSSQVRAVRRDVADGRRLWVSAGAWPWWAIARGTRNCSLDGRLPAKWWEIQEVGDALAAWAQQRRLAATQ